TQFMGDISFQVRPQKSFITNENSYYKNLKNNITDLYISCGIGAKDYAFERSQFSPTLDFAYPVKILSVRMQKSDTSIFKFADAYSTETWNLILFTLFIVTLFKSISKQIPITHFKPLIFNLMFNLLNCVQTFLGQMSNRK